MTITIKPKIGGIVPSVTFGSLMTGTEFKLIPNENTFIKLDRNSSKFNALIKEEFRLTTFNSDTLVTAQLPSKNEQLTRLHNLRLNDTFIYQNEPYIVIVTSISGFPGTTHTQGYFNLKQLEFKSLAPNTTEVLLTDIEMTLLY